jgi:hypothetical protein
VLGVNTQNVPDNAKPAPWSAGTRIAFRFGFSLAVLSGVHFTGLLVDYLHFDRLRSSVAPWVEAIGNAESAAVRYIAVTVLRLGGGAPGTVAQVAQRHRYALLYLIAVVVTALALTLLWSIADRRPTDYAALNRSLRLYARYSLALVLMLYALVKVVPTQFGFLTPGELLKPVGQLNSFWMLWDFMVVSSGYTVFAGLVELLGCALLFYRRTTLVGALLATAVLVNVFAMDLFYGVFGAAMVAGLLLAMAAIVIAPYGAALIDIFFCGRARALPAEPPITTAYSSYAALAKAVLLALLVAGQVSDGLTLRSTYFGRHHRVYGMFQVDRFVRGGVLITPTADDGLTWKRVGTDGRYDSGAVTVQFASADVRQYRLVDDTARQTWTLRDAGADVAKLHYGFDVDGSLTLEGHIGNDPVQMHLRRIDVATLPLLRGR